MTDPERRCRPPPVALAHLILDHQRWLNSGGRFGKRLDRDELQFDDCDLEGVDLSRARLAYAYFQGGSLRGARFVEAVLPMATFSACDVDGADFSRANLAGATFDTNHEKGCFEGAILDRIAWNAADATRRWAAYVDRVVTPEPR